MKTSYNLVIFDKDSPPPIKDLAQLHQQLLTNSPIVILGQSFMEQFYYKILPRDGLIYGAIAYVENQPVGFIVATHNSSGFMQEALHRHWPYLLWIMFISILQNPKRLVAIWEALQIMKHRQPILRGKLEGELLSFGVLPDYCSSHFIQESGWRITHDLLEVSVNQLQQKKVSIIHAIVDADNTAAKLFYNSLEWELTCSDVPGWRIPSIEFSCVMNGINKIENKT